MKIGDMCRKFECREDIHYKTQTGTITGNIYIYWYILIDIKILNFLNCNNGYVLLPYDFINKNLWLIGEVSVVISHRSLYARIFCVYVFVELSYSSIEHDVSSLKDVKEIAAKWYFHWYKSGQKSAGSQVII